MTHAYRERRVGLGAEAHDRLQAAMREVELDPRELAALTLTSAHEGCSAEWLRPRVGLTQSGTVRLVDRLAGRGVPLQATRKGQARLRLWRTRRDRQPRIRAHRAAVRRSRELRKSR